MILKRSITFFTIFIFCLPLNATTLEGQDKSLYYLGKNAQTPISSINIINVYPHDPKAFTQGLFYKNGFLYESTGLNGRSNLRKVDIQTGNVLQELKLDKKYFAEGITLHKDRIIQLTWKNNVAFVYHLKSFELLNTFKYKGEGWGITTDGKILFMSDGTAAINCIEPHNFTIIRKIKVCDGNTEISNLNELEFIRGEIWANIFMANMIVRISPQTGKVLGWVDLNKLYQLLPLDCTVDVLNGIAYDKDNDRIFVTGKLWPKMFEIKIITKDND